MRTAARVNKKIQDRIVFWLFLAPSLLGFSLVVIAPFIIGIYYSLTNWTAIQGQDLAFIWFENYRDIFSDIKFIYSLLRTFFYTFLNMLSVNIVAFCLAVLVTQNLRYKNIYRAGFFIPNLIGGLILGYIWQFIFNSIVPGFETAILGSEIFSQNPILSKSSTAFIGLIIVGTWQYAGYIMVIYVAALQNVPQELIEASMIDGASGWNRLRNIIFPMVAQAFTICSFLTLVSSFKQYDLIYALTNGGPGARFAGKLVQSTEMLAVHIYNTAFTYNNMAKGQAQAIIFFLILVSISVTQVLINKRREVEM